MPLPSTNKTKAPKWGFFMAYTIYILYAMPVNAYPLRSHISLAAKRSDFSYHNNDKYHYSLMMAIID